MAKLAQDTITKIDASLADDMNTAQALAAVFDMVREANTAADKGELKQGDVSCPAQGTRRLRRHLCRHERR